MNGVSIASSIPIYEKATSVSIFGPPKNAKMMKDNIHNNTKELETTRVRLLQGNTKEGTKEERWKCGTYFFLSMSGMSLFSAFSTIT